MRSKYNGYLRRLRRKLIQFVRWQVGLRWKRGGSCGVRNLSIVAILSDMAHACDQGNEPVTTENEQASPIIAVLVLFQTEQRSPTGVDTKKFRKFRALGAVATMAIHAMGLSN